LRESGAAYQALVEAVFDSAPDIVTGVRDCFEGAAATLRATDYADACPIATVALDVASSDDALRAVTATTFASWLESCASRLERGGIAPVRAKTLATVLVAALEGGFLLSRAAKDTTAMDEIGAVMVELTQAAVRANQDRA
jgi:hypothetical protein